MPCYRYGNAIVSFASEKIVAVIPDTLRCPSCRRKTRCAFVQLEHPAILVGYIVCGKCGRRRDWIDDKMDPIERTVAYRAERESDREVVRAAWSKRHAPEQP